MATPKEGWKSTPFIIACLACLTLASGGWMINFIVFLIQEFNIKSINAAQISNVVSGCTTFFPIIGAILADSFFGCFYVISVASLSSLMGLILLLLTVTVTGLKPLACEAATSICAPPTRTQYSLLLIAITLGSIGVGGTRFTLGTIGANQFSSPKQQSSFFNCWFIALYTTNLIVSTVILYVEDSLSRGWVWGFGISIVANVVGIVAFLAGSKYYAKHRSTPRQADPLVACLRVVVASFMKRKAQTVTCDVDGYYYGGKGVVAKAPSNTIRFLNRAAVKEEGDIFPDGSIAKPWKLCTVQEVENTKSLAAILPLWTSSIFVSTPIAIQVSLTVLQGLTTNRHLGHSFLLPAASVIVITFFSTCVCIALLDYCLLPLWKKKGGKMPTLLQRIAIGHLFNICSMAVSAGIESKRLALSHSHQHRMSILWLFPQMAIVGIGEGFHFPAQVSLYYQQFPSQLKTMSTAMIAMLIGTGFYMGTAITDLVRRVTRWLPDDIDNGRVDNVYWMLVVIGVVNFGYFLVCCWFYEYRNVDVNEGEEHHALVPSM